jgi:hypothetical protein
MNNASGNFDINKWAEKLLIPILNEVYNYNLKNLEIEKKNTAAIDLGEKDKKIAYQVTIDTSVEKIRDTIFKYYRYPLHVPKSLLSNCCF